MNAMNAVALVDWSPALKLALLALVLAALPLGWLAWRLRGGSRLTWLAALTGLTLFLTFDLVVFGSFTRLTDSGLGCPDWPGCYAQASPFGAHAEIQAAQAAEPHGPVTWNKAWIEMIHRYLAMTVGVLALVIAGASLWARRTLPHALHWPLLALAWVVVQGLFGKYTVTLKLYPAIVTAHLLGGLLLLALFAVQHEAFQRRSLALADSLRRLAWLAAGALGVQVALGGWVSTNYAVLACDGFPRCYGAWWPEMDWRHGFTLLRELGRAGDGNALPFEGLVAIQMAHRVFAVVATLLLAALAWRLWRDTAGRRFGRAIALLLAAQLASGLSNVVLGWPLAAALAHSAGAAALSLVLVALLVRSRRPAGAPIAAPRQQRVAAA
jgi:heme a synthase